MGSNREVKEFPSVMVKGSPKMTDLLKARVGEQTWRTEISWGVSQKNILNQKIDILQHT